MLGSGKIRAVRATVTASSPRSHDADVYHRYAAALYRQALLTRNDPALAEHVGCDVITDERALAAIAQHGDDESRYRRAESVLRRCRQLAARPAVADPPPRALPGHRQAVSPAGPGSPPAPG